MHINAHTLLCATTRINTTAGTVCWEILAGAVLTSVLCIEMFEPFAEAGSDEEMK